MSDAYSRLITQTEAAKRLGVSVATVKRLRDAGELSYVPGRPVRIPEDDVQAYIDRIVKRRTDAVAQVEVYKEVAATMRMQRAVRRMRDSMSAEKYAELIAITKARIGD